MNANFILRTNKELIEELKTIAKEEGRSLNKQIEFILKQYINSQTSQANK